MRVERVCNVTVGLLNTSTILYPLPVFFGYLTEGQKHVLQSVNSSPISSKV